MNLAEKQTVNWKHYPSIEPDRAQLLTILERTGTPIFLGQRDNLIDRYQTLTDSLNAAWGPHRVGYSFKTNYLAARSKVFQDCGAWAEVVSGHEYRLARELGYSGPSIIFNGPLKTDADLQTALEDQALINVNDHDELQRLFRLASDFGPSIEIGLRLSSTLPKLGHSRFGFSMENGEAAAAVERIQNTAGFKLTSLHTHLYGDTDDASIYCLAAKRMAEFAQLRIADYQDSLKFLDLGGGFPAHNPQPKSRPTWNPQPIDVYIGAIADQLRPFFTATGRPPTLIVEPGRYLTCDGIMLVSRVIHVKSRDGRQLINCDGSISMVPLTHYSPQLIRVYTPQLQRREEPDTATIIHGSTCRENDILYQGPFPVSHNGDYLVHFAAGAYNSSLSPDFIFPSPRLELF